MLSSAGDNKCQTRRCGDSVIHTLDRYPQCDLMGWHIDSRPLLRASYVWFKHFKSSAVPYFHWRRVYKDKDVQKKDEITVTLLLWFSFLLHRLLFPCVMFYLFLYFMCRLCYSLYYPSSHFLFDILPLGWRWRVESKPWLLRQHLKLSPVAANTSQCIGVRITE